MLRQEKRKKSVPRGRQMNERFTEEDPSGRKSPAAVKPTLAIPRSRKRLEKEMHRTRKIMAFVFIRITIS